MKLNKNDELVITALKPLGTELTLQEIVDKTGQPTKKIFKSLKKLFEHELISSQRRKYRLLKEKPAATAAEDESAEEETE